MNQPNGYADVSANDWEPIKVGGHKAVIMKLEERKNKNGGDMIVVAIDFDNGDAQSGYFMKEFQNDIRPDKKWPNAGMLYINVADQSGKCSKNFKSFITSVERSNNMEVQWGENFAKQFFRKKVGVVYGEVEEEYNGKVSWKRKFKWCCDFDKALDAKVPERKPLNSATASSSPNDFISVSASNDEEEIPF